MKIKYDNFYINVQADERIKNSSLIPIIFLHGFTGSSKDWEIFFDKIPKEFAPAAIDIIGHGKSDSPIKPEYYSSDEIVDQLFAVIQKLTSQKIVLHGYSMGGRAAISYSVKHSDTLRGLILESTTAGIKDKKERNERVKRDEKLSDFILGHTMEEFVELWMSLDVFDTQKRFSNKRLDEIKADKNGNSKIGLANSLRRFSTGMMIPLYDELKKVDIPALVISGELDTKFTEISRELVKYLPNAEHQIMKNSGHNIHLEEPKRFIEAINKFLTRLS